MKNKIQQNPPQWLIGLLAFGLIFAAMVYLVKMLMDGFLVSSLIKCLVFLMIGILFYRIKKQ